MRETLYFYRVTRGFCLSILPVFYRNSIWDIDTEILFIAIKSTKNIDLYALLFFKLSRELLINFSLCG